MLSLRDLIVAQPETPIADVMIEEPVAVGVLEPTRTRSPRSIARYNLLAVPVVDDDGRLEGIVTVDDAIDTVAADAWKRRLPRVFSRRPWRRAGADDGGQPR